MVSTTIEERVDIVESAEKGEASFRTARRLGWQQRTIQKWRQRGRQGGRAGLKSQMGRPASGALSSFTPEIGETLQRWRQENPGWGATTLRAELALHEAFADAKLPSRATIARFLSEEKLVAEREPAVVLPESQTPMTGQAHHVWEMDARGYEQMSTVGFVSLIHLNDRFSHARLLSYPCWLGQTKVERHARTEDYQACLRLAFMEWGLPQTIQVDHESVFFDNRSKSPFPTRFHLWLISLGIQLSFIRVHQPKDQAMTERSHQLWSQQVLQGHTFPDWSALYAALEKRRTFLNHHLPCRSLAGQPPLVAHPEALHSGLAYDLSRERDLLDLQRIDAYLAQGRWFRFVSQAGTISLGGQVYSLGAKWKRQQVEITFDADTRHLRFADEAGESITHLALKGICKNGLMGGITDFVRFPSFQIALPFCWEQQQNARLYETIP